jgi:endonuclease YncB( thermonuclease family)
MTTRKENLRLPPRTPAYVDRETGAAEFCVSPETWDRWDREGRLPSPAPGFPPSTRRWRWADVDRKISGKPDNDAEQEADERVPHLLATPAAVRFLSAEPLLGPINLTRMKLGGGWYDVLGGWRDLKEQFPGFDNQIDWVIVGGESGPKARPMRPQWVRDLRDQCSASGVAFFFKQWGAWRIDARSSRMPDDGKSNTWIGKDGRTFNPSAPRHQDCWAMVRVGKPPDRRPRVERNAGGRMKLIGIYIYVLLAAAIVLIGHHWYAHGQAAVLTGHVYVLDRDTVDMGEIRIRLFGIGAPESEQTCKDAKGETYRCGLVATAVLEEEIGGRVVTCFPMDTDIYGRTVATCQVNGHDLGDAMVRRGMAIAYLRYSAKYMEAEVEARRARRGVWQGEFVEPEEWRHRQ